MNDLDKLLSKLDNVKVLGDNFTAKCPVHPDSENSLSIFKSYDGNYIPWCHAGCDYNSLKVELDLSTQTFKDKGIVEIYQYYTKDGIESYQNVRYFPKDFRQRRKVDDKWVWNLKDIEVTLYHLPELLASDLSRAVFYCEGEKDANRLASLDLISISGKWKDSFSEFLNQRVVYILQDNDDAGQKQALKKAEGLYNVAKTIKIIDFSPVFGSEKGDVSNYLDKHSLEELKALIKSTKNFTPDIRQIPLSELKTSLPASPDLEISIIDTCLSDNYFLTRLMDFCTDTDFYLPIHKKSIKIMTELYESTGSVDFNLLKERLTEEPKELIESLKSKLTGNTLSFYNFDLYSKVIAHKSKLRDLIRNCEYLSSKAREDLTGEIFDEAEEKIYAINQISEFQNSDFYSFDDLADEAVAAAIAFSESDSILLGISTGFEVFDGITNGLQSEDIIIVAARPSMGKTSLCLDVANNVGLDSNLNTAIFSLEMSKEQITNKLISQRLKIPLNSLKSWNLTFSQTEEVHAFRQELKQKKTIHINAMPGMNVLQMRRALRRLEKKSGKLHLIIVDYIQLMSGVGKSESRTQEITAISRELKQTARIFKVPIIVVSQLNRSPEARKSTDYRPMMGDLRESGAIEQDADTICFVYREDYYKEDSSNPGLTELIFSKNRNNPTGTRYLQFVSNITHFENSDYEAADY